jgi:hypothetical protein
MQIGPTASPVERRKITSAAIVGITAGVLVPIVISVVIGYFLLMRKGERKKDPTDTTMSQETPIKIINIIPPAPPAPPDDVSTITGHPFWQQQQQQQYSPTILPDDLSTIVDRQEPTAMVRQEEVSAIAQGDIPNPAMYGSLIVVDPEPATTPPEVSQFPCVVGTVIADETSKS